MKKLIRKYDAGFNNVENLELYLAVFIFRYSYNAYERTTAMPKLLHIFKENKNYFDNIDNIDN